MKDFRWALILVVLIHSFANAGWIDRKAEGWAWYEDLEKEEEKPETIPVQPLPAAVMKQSLSPSDELAQVKKEMENSLAEAVLRPTTKSVGQYMEMQKKWVDQSGLFAQTWTHVLLEKPFLDETTKSPVSQYGIQVQKMMIQEKKETVIRQLAKERGLFFFYEGKKKASAAFALVVKAFAQRYQWEVFAVSLDQTKLEGFKNNQQDNGISRGFAVEITPSLYVVNPKTHEVVPIAFGLITIQQIENNILLQFTEPHESLDD
ncbi:Type IV conjugative transfer system pilus assembly protein TraF (plasmid) [Candidatus Protochlamydia naegleriophila]|uniref:Type IV conjugative transfer system pilus assembly protein TraF n=1 Tax=Candidatus Protochlamydia naegleriophila TaxID=389348 RepID=A0A0U5JG76_9BACT|nr:type-F conjugative transfer system pilin assembly protein TraF [Candidatus Protochlamydia naegleriophila]CUI18199.1 Type IV conjugative transfer system pilus assembly protein TraF [Candidatus Protochlamydia naegleriophila]